MKKLTTVLFALAVLAMTFVACGGSETEEPPAAKTAEPAAAPAEQPAAEEPPAEGEEPAGEAQPKAQ